MLPDFRTLFEAAPIAIVVVLPDDPLFTMVAVSDLYLQGAQMSREEIVGRGLFDVFKGPDPKNSVTLDHLRASFRRVVAERQPESMPVQQYNQSRPGSKDGELEDIYWSPTNTPLLGPNGEVEFIFHQVQNVTELVRLKRMEVAPEHLTESIGWTNVARALRESEQRLRAIFDSTYEYIGLLSPDGTLLEANRASLEFAGLKRDDVVGRSFWDTPWFTSTPGAPEAVRQAVSRATRGESVRFENTLRTPSGELITFDSSFHPVSNEEGDVVLIVPEGRNITERKQVELALAERGEIAALGAEVGALLTQMPDLAQTLQQCAQAVVKHLDAAFARIWTISAAGDVLELQASAGLYTHLNGLHSRVLVGSFKIGRIAERRKPHLTNDVLRDAEISDPDWAQREGMISFAGYPLVVEDRLVGVLALFARHSLAPHVLTALKSVSDSIAIGIERKRAEEELARRAHELMRSNVDLQQFAFAASHDLQEPLRMISSYSQLLVKRFPTQLDANAALWVKFITEGVRHMRDLLEDLLAYSKLNAGNESSHASLIDLNEVFQKTLDNLKTAVEESQSVVTSDQLPVVHGHESHFVQLLQNLIGNAIKYRRESPPRVHLSAAKEKDVWRLAVADNGMGIEPAYHQTIFGVFKRLHGKQISGTGIGLAICQRVVERYGGRIWVESELNQGSTFYCTLPTALVSLCRPVS